MVALFVVALRPAALNGLLFFTFLLLGWGQGNVLYVGTTYTPHGDYRHDVPAISSRNLLDLKFAEYSFSKQSTLRIDVKYRDRFLVNYVYGFNSSSHVYFLTVQRKSHLPGHEEQGYITRISRACVTDANFDTYTEVTLECGDSGRFNLVQDAYLVEKSDSLSHRFHTVRNDSFLVASFAKSQHGEFFTTNKNYCFVFYDEWTFKLWICIAFFSFVKVSKYLFGSMHLQPVGNRPEI